MRIDVTADHIRRGNIGNPDSCMIALAVREATRLPFRVGHTCVYIAGADAVFALPDFVVEKRRAFDAQEPVTPFSFELALDQTWGVTEPYTQPGLVNV